MTGDVYTLGAWRVQDGKQREFLQAWKDLASHFHELDHPPGEGILLQSVDDPRQSYSFGPWRTLDDVEAMRRHADTPRQLARLVDLCDEATPGTFRVVARA